MAAPKTFSFPTTVLVVDDEPVILKTCTKILERRSLPVVAVASGEEAIDALQSQGIGCLLTDKNLPGVDGLEVIRVARKVQPYCACIMLTGFASTDSVIEALRLGAVDYLKKPLDDVSLLAARIEKAITHQQAVFERGHLLETIAGMQTKLTEGKEAPTAPAERPAAAVAPEPRPNSSDDRARLVRELMAAIETSRQANSLIRQGGPDSADVAQIMVDKVISELNEIVRRLKHES